MGVKGLGDTGKTLIEEWLTEQEYGQTKEFTSKYTDKGIRLEPACFEMISEQCGIKHWTEQDEFENEYFIGHTDILEKDGVFVDDGKVAWDCFTFPRFKIKLIPAYDWQMQVYMELTGRPRARVHFCLLDSTPEMIMEEANSLKWKRKLDEVNEELIEEVTKKRTYSHLPIEMRYKCFETQKDPSRIALLTERVLECRAIIKSITNLR